MRFGIKIEIMRYFFIFFPLSYVHPKGRIFGAERWKIFGFPLIFTFRASPFGYRFHRDYTSIQFPLIYWTSVKGIDQFPSSREREREKEKNKRARFSRKIRVIKNLTSIFLSLIVIHRRNGGYGLFNRPINQFEHPINGK
jgi:hypothetical protein